MRGAWLILIILILISLSVHAVDPQLPPTTDQITQQRLAEILGKVNSFADKIDSLETKMDADLNKLKLSYEAKLDNTEKNIQETLQHKTDFPTLVVSLVMVSVLNWVLFALLKAGGKL